ncbi:MAG: T9SS type A sorting domain-containing protein [Ignavibacteria bacterium]|nr:T9SS type A sorting domain-containing protein [Ignavibacteria bacterium]
MKKVFTVLMFILTLNAFSEDNVKIMTYNLLNYPDIDSVIRNPRFRTVIRNSAPDILVVQEMTSQAGMNGFLSNVMNAYGNVYSMGQFIDGTDTDNGIFFKTVKFHFISNTRIRTALRDINQFKIIHVDYPDDTLRIFSVHLKSSSGAANENLRAAEVDSLRKFTNTLPLNSLYMVVGDFNIYGSYEPAYIKLMAATDAGYFVDPIPNMTGVWNNSAYAQYHTQSPRVRGFGGGSTGGMDDRFDMILLAPDIYNNGRIAYIQNSLTSYGNDGNHYNDSINQRPNTSVPDSVADAIHYAADHIPVFATFKFGNPIGISGNGNGVSLDYVLGQNYPNPFNPTTKIEFSIPKSSYVSLSVYNTLGQVVRSYYNTALRQGIYSVLVDAAGLPSGVYFYTLTANDFTQTKKMILIK